MAAPQPAGVPGGQGGRQVAGGDSRLFGLRRCVGSGCGFGCRDIVCKGKRGRRGGIYRTAGGVFRQGAVLRRVHQRHGQLPWRPQRRAGVQGRSCNEGQGRAGGGHRKAWIRGFWQSEERRGPGQLPEWLGHLLHHAQEPVSDLGQVHAAAVPLWFS